MAPWASVSAGLSVRCVDAHARVWTQDIFNTSPPTSHGHSPYGRAWKQAVPSEAFIAQDALLDFSGFFAIGQGLLLVRPALQAAGRTTQATKRVG